MKYKTRLELFQDLNNLQPSQIEDTIDNFTNGNPERFNRLVHAFMEYLKAGIIEAYLGYNYKVAGYKLHFYKEDHNEGNAVLEFSERFGSIRNNSIDWKEFSVTNSNPIDERLLYFEIICDSFQKACSSLFLDKLIVSNFRVIETIEEKKGLKSVVSDSERGIKKQSLKEIALKYVYEDKIITRENANQIAVKFGHNSGDKLYQFFTFYYARANRKADPEGKIKLLNKIRLFESVIMILSEKAKLKALAELEILRSFISKY